MDKNGLGEPSQQLNALSILIGGKNTLGYTGDGTKAPVLEFNKVDEESTGILKPLSMTLEVENLGIEFIAHIFAGLPFVLKGNIHEDGENKLLLITVQAKPMKMESTLKVGEKAKRSFELMVNMYSEIVDNIPTIVYTRSPYTAIIGGIDTAPNLSDNL